MFTGIIEATAEVVSLKREQSNLHLQLKAVIAPELKIDQSISHNGVCLTVVQQEGETYLVTAIDETLKKTNLGSVKTGDLLNLERCLAANGRFDGHIVQGHIDTTAVCTAVEEQDGSWLLTFSYEASQRHHITVEKGSICVNGVSLTVVNSGIDSFSVAIIPYTYEHTNFKYLKAGDRVNLEFDIIGKYIARLLETSKGH